MKSKEELEQEILDKLNLITPSTSEGDKKELRKEIDNMISEYIYYGEPKKYEVISYVILISLFMVLIPAKILNIIDIPWILITPQLILIVVYSIIKYLIK